ncbi:MAG: type II toxin-antitoxin system HicB family antitoxin [Deltaproteobacteria bacterium]|nr:type II toxin-antitoxin system HicB family antitoxin [Deltaproteobacteria bacterium]
MKYVGFKEYVREVLKTAKYVRDAETGCVVATTSVLPGCMTQGDDFEDARDNLIDAIELWVTVGLREGEEIPVVNGVELASAMEQLEAKEGLSKATYG